MNTSVATLNVMQILRTFMTSTHAAGPQLICAHPTNALEVLKHQSCFFQTFRTLPGHILHTFIADISDIPLLNLLVHIWLMLWKFLIFPGHRPKHQGCSFQIFWTLLWHVLHLAYWFQIFWMFNASFICAHSADAPEVLNFFRTFAWAPALFFLDILENSRTCITFDIFISDLSDIQHLIYLCTFCWCSRSSAFFRTFTQAPGLFCSDIPDTPRKCITFDIFISDISDIQQLIYLCNMYYIWYIYFRYFGCAAPHLFLHILLMLWKFCIFSGHLPEHQGCFFFFGYSRHSQDMYYIWHIYFRYFRHSAPHLFVHALEVLYFFRTFTWAPGLFSFGYSGHSWDMYYISFVVNVHHTVQKMNFWRNIPF